MNDLVFKGQNDQVITSSYKVAETFKKNHSDVVRSIDRLVVRLQPTDYQCDAKMRSGIIFEEHFEDVPQPNGGTKKAKYFIMNKDAFTLLAMGFTGAKAVEFKIRYINEFNKMEAELKSQQAKQLAGAEYLIQRLQMIEENDRQLSTIKQEHHDLQMDVYTLFNIMLDIRQKLNNEIGRYAVIGYCSLHNINITRKEAAIIGSACARMCKKEDIPAESIADPRFGKVGTFPSKIIAKCYEERQKKLLGQTV